MDLSSSMKAETLLPQQEDACMSEWNWAFAYRKVRDESSRTKMSESRLSRRAL